MSNPTFTIKQIGVLTNIWEKKSIAIDQIVANTRTLDSLYKIGLIDTFFSENGYYWRLTQKGNNYMINAMNMKLGDNFQLRKSRNDDNFFYIRRKKLRKFPKELII